jgi:hypothetical protein
VKGDVRSIAGDPSDVPLRHKTRSPVLKDINSHSVLVVLVTLQSVADSTPACSEVPGFISGPGDRLS